MSTLRIIITAVVSVFLFMGMAMIEERDTFEAFFASMIGLPVSSPIMNPSADQQPIEKIYKSSEKYAIYLAISSLNNAILVAGRNGVFGDLEKAQATAPVIERAKMDIQMALNRDLPHPIGELVMRLMDVYYDGPTAASAVVIEDWQYGNATGAPVFFRITMRYSLRKSADKWIITNYSPNKPFEVKP